MLKSEVHAEQALPFTGPGIAVIDPHWTLQQESWLYHLWEIQSQHTVRDDPPLTVGIAELTLMEWA